MDKEWIDIVDRYIKGKANADEVIAIENKMRDSHDFRQQVADHKSLITSMVNYNQHQALKAKLETFHQEDLVATKQETKTVRINKYWAVSAVAASVALVSILGTVLVTNWYASQRETQFQSLSRKVAQLDRSTKNLKKDLEATKKKAVAGNYAGTCFMISREGYLVTSYHVVKDADSLHIENARFGTLRASVVYHDPANDVSVLKVDTLIPALPFTIEKVEASLADDVYTLGYPREDIVFGEGAISALSGFKQNPNSYQVSVPVNPGNSGGPLLNNKGNLVGMISGSQTESAGTAFAIKSTVLMDIVAGDSLKSTVNLPTQSQLKFNSRVGQVNSWKDFVFMVQVFKN
jgi:serine protease Do